MTEPTTCREFHELMAVFRNRLIELNTTMEVVDEVAGLPQRYCSKILAAYPLKGLGRLSLGGLLGALGLKLLVLEDAEALARVRNRLTPRKSPAPKLAFPRNSGKHAPVSIHFLRKIAPLGGLARAARMNPSWRRGIARKAARARWGRAHG